MTLLVLIRVFFDNWDTYYDLEIIDNYLVSYSHKYNHDKYFDFINLNCVLIVLVMILKIILRLLL